MRKEELVANFTVKITKIMLELHSLGESISEKEEERGRRKSFETHNEDEERTFDKSKVKYFNYK
ncbi:unnamed protein product [Spirodela intermedia]|uniref:Uncharacterized protein n=1 Tax=Spirodela intermedia TaxID=51605 RepID=A0A7I8I7Z3_SPIIN|nr:unnamed protein product [Spirodela intermedia]CAA6653584.1 unnamed protein product [Spirodela intermedia]